ncbi:MAG: hypothetical protein QG564_25 [Campylobacterota bacterium]|nr:hypothetical protein [Campylobacterota bacterium]
MLFGDILYIVAVIIFVFITFGIVRNYYKSKFDDEGRRMDMPDDPNEKD